MYVYFAMLYARAPRKVIMHKSCGEIYLVEQNTIEHVSAAYFKFISLITNIQFSWLKSESNDFF